MINYSGDWVSVHKHEVLVSLWYLVSTGHVLTIIICYLCVCSAIRVAGSEPCTAWTPRCPYILCAISTVPGRCGLDCLSSSDMRIVALSSQWSAWPREGFLAHRWLWAAGLSWTCWGPLIDSHQECCLCLSSLQGSSSLLFTELFSSVSPIRAVTRQLCEEREAKTVLLFFCFARSSFL